MRMEIKVKFVQIFLENLQIAWNKHFKNANIMDYHGK